MATPIASYDELQSEIAGWLNRQDLTSEIPTFIRLLEARINRKSRCWQMVKRAYAPLQPNAEYLPLPGDYLELKRARLVGSLVQVPQPAMQYASDVEIDRIQHEAVQTQMPHWYNIVGNALRFGPVPDQAYTAEIVYYAKLPALAETAQTNWLLADHPDIYLYGSLMGAARYLKSDPRVPTWKSALDEALGELDVSNEGGERGGQPLRATFRPYGGRRGRY